MAELLLSKDDPLPKTNIATGAMDIPFDDMAGRVAGESFLEKIVRHRREQKKEGRLHRGERLLNEDDLLSEEELQFIANNEGVICEFDEIFSVPLYNYDEKTDGEDSSRVESDGDDEVTDDENSDGDPDVTSSEDEDEDEQEPVRSSDESGGDDESEDEDEPEPVGSSEEGVEQKRVGSKRKRHVGMTIRQEDIKKTCTICGYRSERKSNLVRHMGITHGAFVVDLDGNTKDFYPHKCKLCEKQFCNKSDLRRHLETPKHKMRRRLGSRLDI